MYTKSKTIFILKYLEIKYIKGYVYKDQKLVDNPICTNGSWCSLFRPMSC